MVSVHPDLFPEAPSLDYHQAAGRRAALRLSLLTAARGLPPLGGILVPPGQHAMQGPAYSTAAAAAAVPLLLPHGASSPVLPVGSARPLQVQGAVPPPSGGPSPSSQGGLRNLVATAVLEAMGASAEDDDTPLMAAGRSSVMNISGTRVRHMCWE